MEGFGGPTNGRAVRMDVVVAGDNVVETDTVGVRLCVPACPVDALSFGDGLLCDRAACIRCFCCAEVCPRGALSKRFS